VKLSEAWGENLTRYGSNVGGWVLRPGDLVSDAFSRQETLGIVVAVAQPVSKDRPRSQQLPGKALVLWSHEPPPLTTTWVPDLSGSGVYQTQAVRERPKP
jgi:hypothetical protein